jgi:hypothetical protein
MKIYIIKSKWVEDGVETNHPDSFVKAESNREADRVFRKGFTTPERLVVISVEELTWEMFNQITPDEFMIFPHIEF